MNKAELFCKYKRIIRPVLYVKNLFSLRIIKHGKNNIVSGLDVVLAKHADISIKGNNNSVSFGEMTTLDHCRIIIEGDDNHIIIGKRNYLLECEFVCEDSGNRIYTGEHTYIHNESQLAATEGKQISIGTDCLLSSEIDIRTGDSHVIYEAQTKSRCNYASDVSIGHHVWICSRAIILKGSHIEDNCIIGTGSVVTKKTQTKKGSIISGNPAKAVKNGVNWYADRRNFEKGKE